MIANGEDTLRRVSGGIASRSGGLARLRVSRRSAPLFFKGRTCNTGAPAPQKTGAMTRDSATLCLTTRAV